MREDFEIIANLGIFLHLLPGKESTSLDDESIVSDQEYGLPLDLSCLPKAIFCRSLSKLEDEFDTNEDSITDSSNNANALPPAAVADCQVDVSIL